MTTNLVTFFEDFLKKEPLLINKKVLQANYTPDNIPHREDQIRTIAGILAPCLKLEKPSNIFLYGKTGTGKTLTIKYVTKQILEVARQKNLNLKVIYVNCKLKRVSDTEYRLIAQLANEFGKEIPPTGLPTDEVYKLFIKTLDNSKSLVIIILDEIDQLVKKVGDNILYNLTRLTSELKNSEITIIGISNDLKFTEDLDARVRSSLSEEELVFPPYDALQIKDILKQRSILAFRDDAIDEGVVEKCAAYAAREHGDARRALDLLRVAAELAERKNKSKVDIEDIDAAEDKIEKDRVLDIIKTQPKQFQLTLMAILITNERGLFFTGDVYDVYKNLCEQCGLKPLTQRRVSDIIAEFDMLGIINAKVISKGRYGRTREIGLAIPSSTIPTINNILKEGLNL